AVAGLAHRPANGLAALVAVLFTNRAAHLVAALVAMLFVNLLAAMLHAILVAHLAHLLANRVAAVAAAGLVDRLAHGLAHLLAVGLISRLVDRVMALFQYRAVDGAANGALLGAPLGFAALLVASSLFGAVAGLANRAHDGLANGLMAHMEPLF